MTRSALARRWANDLLLFPAKSRPIECQLLSPGGANADDLTRHWSPPFFFLPVRAPPRRPPRHEAEPSSFKSLFHCRFLTRSPPCPPLPAPLLWLSGDNIRARFRTIPNPGQWRVDQDSVAQAGATTVWRRSARFGRETGGRSRHLLAQRNGIIFHRPGWLWKINVELLLLDPNQFGARRIITIDEQGEIGCLRLQIDV